MLLLAILAAGDNSGLLCLTAMACRKAFADACSQAYLDAIWILEIWQLVNISNVIRINYISY